MKKLLVSLSFDDGYQSQFKYACPILDTYGFKATFYVITRYFEEWDADYMSSDKLLRLRSWGHEIGSHTVTHPYLWQFWKRDEISRSKEQLEGLLNVPIKSFAYPYGRYNDTVVNLVEKAGYQNARVVKGDYEYNLNITSRYKICCKSVKWNTTIQEVRQWIHDAINNEFWLVLNFHQVSEDYHMWGCRPKMLEIICSILKKGDSDVRTVSDACDIYGLE